MDTYPGIQDTSVRCIYKRWIRIRISWIRRWRRGLRLAASAKSGVAAHAGAVQGDRPGANALLKTDSVGRSACEPWTAASTLVRCDADAVRRKPRFAEAVEVPR